MLNWSLHAVQHQTLVGMW